MWSFEEDARSLINIVFELIDRHPKCTSPVLPRAQNLRTPDGNSNQRDADRSESACYE